MNINEKLEKIKWAYVATDVFEQAMISLFDQNNKILGYLPYNINNREKILNILKENNKEYHKNQQNKFLKLVIYIMTIIINILFYKGLILEADILVKTFGTILNTGFLMVSIINIINTIYKIKIDKKNYTKITNNYLLDETKELKEKLYNSSKEINQALKEKIEESLSKNNKDTKNIKQKEIVNINDLYDLINHDKEESLINDNPNKAIVLTLKRK